MELKKVNSFQDIEHTPNTIYVVGEEVGSTTYFDNSQSYKEFLPLNISEEQSRVVLADDYTPPPWDGLREVVYEQQGGRKDPLLNGEFVLYLMEYNGEVQETEDDLDAYVYTSATYIPITVFRDGSSSLYSTFNEKLNMAENDQYELSFSISKMVEGLENPFAKRLRPNIRLRYVDAHTKIDFIIKSVAPQVSKGNVVYNILAESAFSYIMSKRGVGYETYTPEDDPLAWWNLPHSITDIVGRILEENNIYAPGPLVNGKPPLEWTIHPRFTNSMLSPFPDELYKFTTQEQMRHAKMCLEVSDSNVYNAIVETMLLFGGVLSVEYNDDRPGGVLNFINKQLVDFKGYRLHPDINLTALSYSEKVTEYCTLMRVFGGETADGQYISMLPPMPDVLAEYVINKLVAKGEEKTAEDYFTKEGRETLTMVQLFSNIPTADAEERALLIGYCEFVDNYTPSLDSYLYSFDDLVESGAMAEEAREWLHATYYKLRNCNLIIQAFHQVYTALSFYHQERVKQEEELVAMWAAENRAYILGGDSITYTQATADIQNALKKVYQDEMALLSVQLFGDDYATDSADELAEEGEKYQELYEGYLKEAAAVYKESGEESVKAFLESMDYNRVGKYDVAMSKANALLEKVALPHVVNDGGNIVTSKDVVAARKGSALSYYDIYCRARKGPNKELWSLDECMGEYSSNNKPITHFLNYANDRKSKINRTLYSLSTHILERNYIDETQLTYDGLYQSASREFFTYNRPTEEYSATMINYGALMDKFRQDIAVGDKIYAYSPPLWEEEQQELYVYIDRDRGDTDKDGEGGVVEEILSQNEVNLCWSHYDSNGKTVATILNHEVAELKTLYGTGDFIKLTVRMEDERDGWEPGDLYAVAVPDPDSEVGYPIHYAAPVKAPAGRELQITGISRVLRSSITELSVENNKTINSLIDKLLMSIRRK